MENQTCVDGKSFSPVVAELAGEEKIVYDRALRGLWWYDGSFLWKRVTHYSLPPIGNHCFRKLLQISLPYFVGHEGSMRIGSYRSTDDCWRLRLSISLTMCANTEALYLSKWNASYLIRFFVIVFAPAAVIVHHRWNRSLSRYQWLLDDGEDKWE